MKKVRSRLGSAVFPSADAERSRRTICLRTGKRTDQSVWEISANRWSVERRTQAVDKEKREREARKSAVRPKIRLWRNLWPELGAQRKLDAGSRNVQ